MMNLRSHEALINEIKGSLFEFLVAQELSRFFHIEKNFLDKLDPGFYDLLTIQDRMLRENAPELVERLPVWSKELCQKLIPQLKMKEVTNILLVGDGQEKQLIESEWKETDIFLVNNAQREGISLKLNKKNAYVNTKSAGIKSFLTKYFSDFMSENEQKIFNHKVDSAFALMCTDLHELAGMSVETNFKHWEESGRPSLPGELAPDLRQRLHTYYAELSSLLSQQLRSFYKINPETFTRNLAPLMGHGQNLIQAVCFYGARFEESDYRIHEESFLTEELEFMEFEDNRETASVELKLKTTRLQIRIKPMNKFTQSAVKINCSVKF